VYKLSKLYLNDGAYSAVGVGHSMTGSHLAIFLAGTDEGVQTITDVHYIVVGKQVVLSEGMHWLTTSPVKKINAVSETTIIFDTQTSTYKLEELEPLQEQ